MVLNFCSDYSTVLIYPSISDVIDLFALLSNREVVHLLIHFMNHINKLGCVEFVFQSFYFLVRLPYYQIIHHVIFSLFNYLSAIKINLSNE